MTFAVESNGLILNNNMENIFKQAHDDVFSTRLTTEDSVSYIRKGIKMENKNNEIRIYNTKFGDGFYTELKQDEYEIFHLKGWRIGCYMMAIKNYRRSLDNISAKIILEINSRKNNRHYMSLKEMRSDIMGRLTETLKLLKIETNGERI